MANNLKAGLKEAREELLKDFIRSRGSDKADILQKILEIDEQIEEENRLAGRS